MNDEKIKEMNMKISGRIRFMLLLLSCPTIIPLIVTLIGWGTGNQMLAIVSGSITLGSIGAISWTMLIGYLVGLIK